MTKTFKREYQRRGCTGKVNIITSVAPNDSHLLFAYITDPIFNTLSHLLPLYLAPSAPVGNADIQTTCSNCNGVTAGAKEMPQQQHMYKIRNKCFALLAPQFLVWKRLDSSHQRSCSLTTSHHAKVVTTTVPHQNVIRMLVQDLNIRTKH